jgi:hypothetical protein
MVQSSSKENMMGTEYLSKLSKDWKDYEQTVKDQLQTGMDNQRSMYDALSMRWADNSKNLRAQIMSTIKSGNDGTQELYNFLRNYQNKLNARIHKASELETTEYNTMLEKWVSEATKVDGLLFQLERTEGNKENDPTLMDLYSSWINLSNDMTRQFAKALQEGNGEYDKLAVTWKEFLDGTQEILMKVPSTNPNYEALVATWKETTHKMGNDLSLLIKEGNMTMEQIRRSWAQATEKMRQEMYVLFKEQDYEKLYLGFIERATSTMGRNWPLPITETEITQMQSELNELRNNIDELERQINKDEE